MMKSGSKVVEFYFVVIYYMNYIKYNITVNNMRIECMITYYIGKLRMFWSSYLYEHI